MIAFIQNKDQGKRKYDEYDSTLIKNAQTPLLNEKEIEKIKERFHFPMTYQQFKQSLGILGVPNFLAERLFKLIGGTVIQLEDFLNFLNILLHGNKQQKADMSFRFLDYHNRGKLLYKDVEQMFQDVLLFWHYMTGSKILPNPQKIQQVLSALDSQRTGEITFQEYLNSYDHITDLLDWYEFFNEPEKGEKQDNQFIKYLTLTKVLDTLESNILNCMKYIRAGPCSLQFQLTQNEGDRDPSEESEYSKQVCQLNECNDKELLRKLEDYFKDCQELIVQQHRNSRNSNVHRRVTMGNLSKKKHPIYFGHQNWDLILNMMIGMRAAVHSLPPIEIELQEEDYKNKYVHDLIMQKTKQQSHLYKFKDYAPKVFNKIRQCFEISKKDYLKSVGPERLLGNLILGKLSSLTELSSSGKSGSFFYFTEDSKYMIKTISKNEFQLMRKILKQYYQHLMKNKNTLLSRILGLHRMCATNSNNKIYIIVISNLFQSPLNIDVRYDLKGSTYARRTRNIKNQYILDKNTALKDLDFLDDKILINIPNSEQFIKQIKLDVLFLQNLNIIDYSLLVGIHNPSFQSIQNNIDGIVSKDKKYIYFIGIIDILTEFKYLLNNISLKKQFEYSMKTTFVDSNVSCIPPSEYASRFLNFMTQKVFM